MLMVEKGVTPGISVIEWPASSENSLLVMKHLGASGVSAPDGRFDEATLPNY